jgi:hypothetical protein
MKKTHLCRLSSTAKWTAPKALPESPANYKKRNNHNHQAESEIKNKLKDESSVVLGA